MTHLASLGSSYLALAVVGLLVVALLVRYMRRSTVRQVALSSLRFLPELSPATKRRTRWQFAAPLASPLFWLRLVALLCLFLAPLLDGVTLAKREAPTLGVLIAVDQTPSMAAGAPSRAQQASALAADIADHVAALGGCWRQIALPFTQVSAGAPDQLARDGLSPTDMEALLTASLEQDSSCLWTHVAVISDLPRPPLLALAQKTGDKGQAAMMPLWFEVGDTVANRALLGAGFKAAGLQGDDAHLTLSLAAYGARQDDAALVVTGPDGETIAPAEPIDLSGDSPLLASYPVSRPGVYHAVLHEVGGIAIDNRLDITLGTIANLPIALGTSLAGRPIAAFAGRMAPLVDGADRADAVHVDVYGDGQAVARRGIYLVDGPQGGSTLLGYFDSSSPLLEALDLDLLEALHPHGLDRLPQGFRPVACGADGSIWLATRGGPDPAVIMPAPAGGLGAALSDPAQLTWLVAFVNAYHLVSDDRQQLLAVTHVDEAGEPLRDVAYESNLAKVVGQNPAIADIQPVVHTRGAETPVWPWLLLLAVLALCLERFLALRRERERGAA
nr:hypothetical protein [uncultured Cohaesibacter sp.]